MLNITQQPALRENNQHNFYLRKCEANALFYQRLVTCAAVKISRMLMIDRLPEQLPPLVKLTGLDGKYLSTNLIYGAINKDSLIGQLLFADKKDTLSDTPVPACPAIRPTFNPAANYPARWIFPPVPEPGFTDAILPALFPDSCPSLSIPAASRPG